MGVKSSFSLSGQLHFSPFLTSLSLLPGPRASKASSPLVYSSCSHLTQVDARVRAEKPRMLAKDALWSVRQSRRPLTPRPPTTSSLPLAPVEVPRHPQHATVLAPSFPPLYCPCRACPEPPEPANARASSWLHLALAPLFLSLSLSIVRVADNPQV